MYPAVSIPCHLYIILIIIFNRFLATSNMLLLLLFLSHLLGDDYTTWGGPNHWELPSSLLMQHASDKTGKFCKTLIANPNIAISAKFANTAKHLVDSIDDIMRPQFCFFLIKKNCEHIQVKCPYKRKQHLNFLHNYWGLFPNINDHKYWGPFLKYTFFGLVARLDLLRSGKDFHE